MSNAGDLAETGRRPGAPPVLPPLVPSEPSIQITETPLPERAPGAPPALPLKGPPSAPGMKGTEPAPSIASTPGTFIGESSARLRPPPPGGTLVRDVAIGAGAAVLLAAMVAGAYFLGTRVLGRRVARPVPAQVAASCTLVVATTDGGDGDVYLNGERRGAIRNGEPLTLEGLPSGVMQVKVKRAGAPDCDKSETLDSRLPHVVTCHFAATGTVLLTVLTDGATVLVDKQEISADAAREPLILAAGGPHEITVRKDGFEPQSLSVTVKAGEVQGERVELKPLPAPPPPHGRRSSRESPPDRGAAAPAVAADPEAAPGFLIADTTPWARVILDGTDTNKMTPIAAPAKISLAAGKHTVTFVVDNQRFSYTIMVEPGQDYILKKQLPVRGEN